MGMGGAAGLVMLPLQYDAPEYVCMALNRGCWPRRVLPLLALVLLRCCLCSPTLDDGNSPLHDACLRGDTQKVRYANRAISRQGRTQQP